MLEGVPVPDAHNPNPSCVEFFHSFSWGRVRLLAGVLACMVVEEFGSEVTADNVGIFLSFSSIPVQFPNLSVTISTLPPI